MSSHIRFLAGYTTDTHESSFWKRQRLIVTVKPDDFATLKAMYPTAEIMADSGIDHVFIPKLPIYSGGAHLTLDALLRTGWAPSWNHIPADMPIVAMLANHLTAFR